MMDWLSQPPTVYLLCIGIAGVLNYVPPFLVAAWGRIQVGYDLAAPRPKSGSGRTWVGVVVFVALASAVLTSGASALGVTGTAVAAVYLTAIGLLLFLAGFAFTFILLSFLAPISHES